MLLILLSSLLNIFSSTVFAQLKPGDAEKIATLFISDNPEACKSYFPGCKKLYELVLLSEAQSLELKLKSAAVFGTVYEFTEFCNEGDKNTCDMVRAIFNDTGDDCQKFNKENSVLCSDVKLYRLNTCDNIQDSFLGSVCLKQLLPACRNDIVCMLAWSFAFREDAERLKTTSPSIIKAFTKQYSEDVNLLRGNLKILNSKVTKKSEIIRAPLFPAPKKILDFTVSDTAKNKVTPKDRPEFKSFTTVKAAFTPSMSQLHHPWIRGVGMTVVDWDGDGYMDVFTIDGDNILFFENIDGIQFRKFIINLSSFGIKSAMVDISIADIDGEGTPAILVQSFPKTLYVLRWLKERSSFSSELVALPNFSRTHAYVKFKKGMGIIFPGWAGVSSAPNEMANDYIARIKNKKWTFEKLSTSQTPTLGISVLEKVNGHAVVVISKDLEGGSDFYTVGDDSLTRLPDSGKMNYYANSSTFLKTSKNEELWLTSGNVNDRLRDGTKRKIPLPPSDIEECKKLTIDSEKEFCILRYSRNMTWAWPSLCLLYNYENVKICYMQNEIPGIRNVKMKDPTNYSAQIFRNLNSPVIDVAASKVVADLSQFWHIAPLQSPVMEGFIVSEARANSSRARKLWWLGLTKTGMQKFDLTNSLGLSESYLADTFALADFDRDGQLDMVFRSGNDMVFFKGSTGGDSSLKGNLQSGHLSRTLIKIPINSKE